MHHYTCQDCGKGIQSKETPNSKKVPRFCSQGCFNLSKRKIKDVQAAIAEAIKKRRLCDGTSWEYVN